MRLKQILIVTLWLVALCACKKCVRKEDLEKEAARTMRKRGFQGPSIPTRGSNATGCPVDLYQNWVSTEDGRRSISPWKYTEVTREGYFPSTYMEAQCLCKGCILFDSDKKEVIENSDYNSKPLVVSRMFLKRILCKDRSNGAAETYKLKMVQEDVAVGCFCVRTRT